ncbi:MAG: hypothetical protein ABIP48_02980, partial [Planctomycetota bacterium]
VIESYTRDDHYNRTYRTLQGEPISISEKRQGLEGAWLGSPDQRQGQLVRLAWSQRIWGFNDCGRPATYWYFVHDGRLIGGTGYFVGFNSKTKLPVGYIGLEGFRADKPPQHDRISVDGRRMAYRGAIISGQSYYGSGREPRGYSGEHEVGKIAPWTVYLLSGDRLLEVNLRTRSVGVVQESTGVLAAGKLERVVRSNADEAPKKRVQTNEHLAVRTQEEVHIVDPDGSGHRTYAIPAEIRGAAFTFYELSDGTAMTHLTKRSGTTGTSESTFLWIDEQGNVLRREDVALGQRSSTEPPRGISYAVALAIPAPGIVTPAVVLAMPWGMLSTGEADDYPTAMIMVLSLLWPALLITNLLGAGTAWLCARRQKKYALPWTRTWIVFVFVFGIPGLLGYLFYRGWPVREECPACRETAPRDREACFACGADFPEPAPKGIEVFA